MPDDADMLRTYLAERDVKCPGCAYNLRGLMGERCPECNQKLELRVGLVEPRLAAFIGGLIGIGMGLGFSVLLLAYAAYWGFFTKRASPGAVFIWPVITGTLVGALQLTAWLMLRRRLSRWPPFARWACAAAFFAAAIACPVWFIASVG